MAIKKNTKKRIRIALVSNSAWSAYRFRLGLLKKLKQLGFEVYVLAPTDNTSGELIREGFNFLPIPLNLYGNSPVSDLRLIWVLFKIYRKNEFDFVFHYTAKPNIYGSVAAFCTKTPSIAVTTGLGILRARQHSLSKQLLRILYRITGLLSKEVWFLNNEDADYFKNYKLVPASKIKIISGEGVNTVKYRPPNPPIDYSIKPIRFLFAGRLVWSKGLLELFKAAETIIDNEYDVKFSILGFVVPKHPDAVSREVIEDYDQRGIVQYLGETDDVRPFLAKTHCLLFPSYFGEGIPRILLEAAAMGIPIITTNSVGCKDIVRNKVNGLITEPRNVEDLIDKIKQFLKISPASQREMGIKGRKMVLQKYDEKIIIDRYINTLKNYLRFD